MLAWSCSRPAAPAARPHHPGPRPWHHALHARLLLLAGPFASAEGRGRGWQRRSNVRRPPALTRGSGTCFSSRAPVGPVLARAAGTMPTTTGCSCLQALWRAAGGEGAAGSAGRTCAARPALTRGSGTCFSSRAPTPKNPPLGTGTKSCALERRCSCIPQVLFCQVLLAMSTRRPRARCGTAGGRLRRTW